MQILKSMWAWLKKWWAALLIGVAVVLGGLYVARQRRVGRLLDELTVDRAIGEIRALTLVRGSMLVDAKTSAEDIERIDDEIQRNRRAIIEAHEHAEGLSNAEVDAEFARLGF